MDAHVCPWWLAYTFDHRFRRWVHNPWKLFGEYVKPKMTVVDLGCGLGFNSLGLAEMVGSEGCVVALDIQQKMLNGVMKRATKRGLVNCIETHLAFTNDLRLHVKADFMVAFYVVHEMKNPQVLMRQISENLSSTGRFMMVEPPFHVSGRAFGKSIAVCENSGMALEKRYKIPFGRVAVMKKQVSGKAS